MTHQFLGITLFMKKINEDNSIRFEDYQVNARSLLQTILIPVNATLTKQICHMLFLFNPSKPHIRSVYCSHPLLNVVVCEKPGIKEINYTTLNFSEAPLLAIFKKCQSGEIICSMYICDGIKDCLDGTDEVHCFCFVKGQEIRNSTFCAQHCGLKKYCFCQKLYFQSLTAGCSSYKGFSKSNKNKVLIQTFINTQSTCDKGFEKDCSKHYSNYHESEVLIPRDLVVNECWKQDMYECKDGHGNCYTSHEKCVYNLKTSGVLMYCNNGQHLQNCEIMDCKSIFMYKCRLGYCIPFRYQCDGKWDCWNGDDEIHCALERCKNMYRCKSSSICIHTKNVCDGIKDCLDGEDEDLCTVQYCVPGCTCLNYGIHCENNNQLDRVEPALEGFIYLNISNNSFPLQSFAQYLENAVILISKKNAVTALTICNAANLNSQLKYLDLSFNIIDKIPTKHISCLKNIQYFSLMANALNQIKSYMFKSIISLKFLNLSKNKIAYLLFCSFCGLENLLLLDLTQNSIIQVDNNVLQHSKNSVILTNKFQVCCSVKLFALICTERVTWPSSCEYLLSSWGLSVIGWLVSLPILILNLLSLFKITKLFMSTVTEYELFVALLNSCDFLTGCYLLSIMIKNAVSGKYYIETDLLWRGGLICHSIGIIFLLSIILSALYLLQISLSRYKAVNDPLKKFTKTIKFTSTLLFTLYIPLFLLTLLSVVIIIRYSFEGIQYISSPLCTFLGNTDNSLIQKVLTAVISIYLFSVFIAIMVIYNKLAIALSKRDSVLVQSQLREKQSQMTHHLILVGATNALCWIPSSTFYLASVFIKRFPSFWLYWITLIILPLNSMLNPFMFHLSDIKAKFGRRIPAARKRASNNKLDRISQ